MAYTEYLEQEKGEIKGLKSISEKSSRVGYWKCFCINEIENKKMPTDTIYSLSYYKEDKNNPGTWIPDTKEATICKTYQENIEGGSYYFLTMYSNMTVALAFLFQVFTAWII